MNDRFFVKVLGRGYPPPTDKFRWCTDRLRINPVTRFLKSEEMRSAVVVLGVREAESATRRQTLDENKTGNKFWRRQGGVANRRLFLPILDYSTQDVWVANLLLNRPISMRAQEVADLYANASGECPTVREVKGAPCGKARFGCWTCTVAKKAVTLHNLIKSGHDNLKPLLDFRLWLERCRSNPRYRWKRRRNGTPGPGPMTLEWRRTALDRLLRAQEESGLLLIDASEIEVVRDHWKAE
jgi:DNA sulfur modification protein DndC